MAVGSTNNPYQSMVQAGFAHGHVIHNRTKPKSHRFKYKMCWAVLDLDQLDQWFTKSKLWSHNSWSVFSLYDKDYVSKEKLPIKHKLEKFIGQQSGKAFNGKVMLFTHPKFFGYGFNSVNFYFCYEKSGDKSGLSFIVSEINNTPWGEKYLYLHDCEKAQHVNDSWSFEFGKQFHISPFVAMAMNYRWDFKLSAEEIKVHMWVKKDQETILTVSLDTKITPHVDNNLNSFLLKRPFQPWKMALGIYWQAFKLWVKKLPIYDHPKQ